MRHPRGRSPLAEIEGSNPGLRRGAAAAAVAPEDVLTLIYTSGTTGPPKGVQLSHHNIMFAAKVDRGDHQPRARGRG